ncbi:Bacterial aa3 type cytochrome c oxidase subunit IV [Pseudovibrio axinellae]|uniref:Bacterial aa3 type cytochrome c oxidase subunit IV n=1 Tax=Pseudovibrio axinellae TaxID=989403 RepID=A0A166AAF0_9HYPH|nr:aa3-type cytochrome c oxidase subunit IV [Pseudovibrio axinellae]KZL20788.1 Bacterial aa3 type cytochrome c oxidase subunit IV [Pseudovibrio axinellae]SER22576.1 aa3 type cytochrome c oxidase subunit IV [Pseudovibrio axinellae]
MADGSASVMDYEEHEKTYRNFINFSKVAVLAVLTFVLVIAMIGFGEVAGTVWASITTVATVIAVGIGLATGDKGYVAPGIVFLFACVVTIALTI